MKNEIKDIQKHIRVINDELGNVQKDMKWVKAIGYYLVSVVTILVCRGLS